MRADKLLASLGYGSRKDVKKLLKQGALSVNGDIVKDPKTHVDEYEDEFEVFGEPAVYRKYIYLMMNKPPGVISATEDETEETLSDLLEEEDRFFEPFPVGRLDKDTTGLVLMTNDGKWAHRLMSPNRHVDKIYRVHLAHPVGEKEAEACRKGLTLDDGYVTKPADLDLFGKEEADVVHLTIREGKYHQVKRMFAALGNHVERLKREKIGGVQLDPELEPGMYRELTEEERSLLSGEND
ncbi:pseudouridine synthase [Salisediminibacterium halotolerans]|uniref:Pseudouridine synthase n=1 Tax=Salisediminibacterium halotolerans TaxID=517425 RepID=A0A1H9UX85_9BACI|nr:pseudouridine synthase [Salisediminibacterium haloalkalitolerans]SES14160.1 16S rRNA pseudouridine516 synthase [Salisediminibacterium haloalkalitolerans]